MTGHIGFSYMGVIFLLLLFIPNLMWARNLPQGYTREKENKWLLFFERTGEILTCCCVLAFSDFNWQGWSAWSWWLIGAFALMALYEIWWVRYFQGEKKLENFYSDILGIPLAGATLPVMAFFLLGIYGRVIWLLVATIILGIGHIGIHIQHRRELGRSEN